MVVLVWCSAEVSAMWLCWRAVAETCGDGSGMVCVDSGVPRLCLLVAARSAWVCRTVRPARGRVTHVDCPQTGDALQTHRFYLRHPLPNNTLLCGVLCKVLVCHSMVILVWWALYVQRPVPPEPQLVAVVVFREADGPSTASSVRISRRGRTTTPTPLTPDTRRQPQLHLCTTTRPRRSFYSLLTYDTLLKQNQHDQQQPIGVNPPLHYLDRNYVHFTSALEVIWSICTFWLNYYTWNKTKFKSVIIEPSDYYATSSNDFWWSMSAKFHLNHYNKLIAKLAFDLWNFNCESNR